MFKRCALLSIKIDLLKPDDVVNMAGRPLSVVDCCGILDDAKIERYFELECAVKGLGRGQ